MIYIRFKILLLKVAWLKISTILEDRRLEIEKRDWNKNKILFFFFNWLKYTVQILDDVFYF